MAETTQHRATNLLTMWEAAFFEFPIAGAKWGWGGGTFSSRSGLRERRQKRQDKEGGCKHFAGSIL
jgi:hypothetical protein